MTTQDHLLMDIMTGPAPMPIAPAATIASSKAAYVSDCGKFRYALSRRWGHGRTMVFIMLNPSIADAFMDDPTIRKCLGFARRNGFEAIEVYNLFAYRATDPKDLKRGGYQVGPENDMVIEIMLAQLLDKRDGSKVVCAWGANARDKVIGGRANQLRGNLYLRGVPLHVLKLTKDGIPSHPLMLPYSCELTEWNF